MDTFNVDLPAYRGPVDLLLYLVRRQEVDAQALSLSKLIEQYNDYLDVLTTLDIDGAAEFLEMATTLVELKSRACLPQQEEEESDEPMLEDPRDQLIDRLLEYRSYRDAASMLDELSARWQQRYPRLAADLPERTLQLSDQPLAPLEIWDLVSAFGRILRETRSPPAERVIYDETPITFYMQSIHAQLRAGQQVSFTELFSSGMHKSAMIGMFLAMLELTRHHGVLMQQDALSSEITLVAGPQFPQTLAVTESTLSSTNSEAYPAEPTKDRVVPRFADDDPILPAETS